MDRPPATLALVVRILAGAYALVGVAWVAFSLYILVHSSWTVVVYDQWRIYDDYFSKPFPLNVLALQNGHRPVFPGLLYLVDVYLFGANNRFINVVGVLLAAATASGISWFIWRARQLARADRMIAITFAWIVFFWLGNSRVLGHGNASVNIYLPMAALVFAVWALVMAKDALDNHCGGRAALALLGTALSCFVAAFSFGPGMVTWPAILIVAVMLRMPWKFVATFAVLFAGCLGLYVFVLPEHSQVREFIGFHAFTALFNASIWLGSPFFHIVRAWGFDNDHLITTLCPAVGGTAFLAVAAILVWRIVVPRPLTPLETFCLALVAFSAGCAFLVALSRTEYFIRSPDARVAARYLPWSCLFWVAFMILLGLYAHGLCRRRTLAMTAWVAVLIVAPALMLKSHESYGHTLGLRKDRKRGAAVSLVAGVHDDEAVQRYLFNDARTVYRVADVFRDKGLAMFSWDLAALPGRDFDDEFDLTPETRLDGAVEAITTFADGDRTAARFRGWAIDLDSRRPPCWVVAVDGSGRITGVASFTRIKRQVALKAKLNPRTRLGFSGYIADYSEQEPYAFHAIFQDGKTACRLPVETVTTPGG
ncbi:MAG: hypothetical protein ACYS1E_16820 [Planctomycetota bacterium]|jgi:hypothetical protein